MSGMDVNKLKEIVGQNEVVFLDTFILHFFRHKLPQIEALVKLMSELVNVGRIKLSDLIQSFELKFEELVMEELDFPLCKKALCLLFKPYSQVGSFCFEQLR